MELSFKNDVTNLTTRLNDQISSEQENGNVPQTPADGIDTKVFLQSVFKADSDDNGLVRKQEILDKKSMYETGIKAYNVKINLIKGLKQKYGSNQFIGNLLNIYIKSLESQKDSLQQRVDTLAKTAESFDKLAAEGDSEHIDKTDLEKLISIAGKDGDSRTLTDNEINEDSQQNELLKLEQEQVSSMIENFGEYDTDNNGILDTNELQNPDIADGIRENNRALMFANIDPGTEAWFGYSVNDFEAIQEKQAEGQTLSDISDELVNDMQERTSYWGTNEAEFNEKIDQEREKKAESMQRSQERNSVLNILNKFGEYDTDNNNILDTNELQNPDIADGLRENNRALMFANIDPGLKAWFGYSREDLRAIKGMQSENKTLSEIGAKYVNEKIEASSSYWGTNEAEFNEKIDQMRESYSTRL